jgi:hypothetical protein
MDTMVHFDRQNVYDNMYDFSRDLLKQMAQQDTITAQSVYSTVWELTPIHFGEYDSVLQFPATWKLIIKEVDEVLVQALLEVAVSVWLCQMARKTESRDLHENMNKLCATIQKRVQQPTKECTSET